MNKKLIDKAIFWAVIALLVAGFTIGAIVAVVNFILGPILTLDAQKTGIVMASLIFVTLLNCGLVAVVMSFRKMNTPDTLIAEMGLVALQVYGAAIEEETARRKAILSQPQPINAADYFAKHGAAKPNAR